MTGPPKINEPVPEGMRRGKGGYLVDHDGFTVRERLFVIEYPVDWNGTQAAIRAGYSPKSAADIAHELLRKPKIAEAVADILADRVEKAAVNAQWVLTRLVATEKAITLRGKKANPLHRLKALEMIGRHVDVNAFRTQFGVGNPDGTPLGQRWNFDALTPEEFTEFDRLLRKISGPPQPGVDPLALGNGSGDRAAQPTEGSRGA